jgi:benzoyl-CoA reductase/2-hydroxyglutaryl-CoA dehydratase subunit BcrC/BadD/HgdB
MGGDVFYTVYLPGKQEALEYFTLLLEQVEEKVKNNVGIARSERFRIFYDNVPVWYHLDIFDYLNELGAPAVFDMYSSWFPLGSDMDGIYFDPEKPFESLALHRLYFPPMLSLEFSLERYVRAIKEWHCDGAILLNNRGCKVFSGGNSLKTQILRDKYGVVTMSFEADQADPRTYNEVEVKSKIDKFIELLEARKRR